MAGADDSVGGIILKKQAQIYRRTSKIKYLVGPKFKSKCIARMKQLCLIKQHPFDRFIQLKPIGAVSDIVWSAIQQKTKMMKTFLLLACLAVSSAYEIQFPLVSTANGTLMSLLCTIPAIQFGLFSEMLTVPSPNGMVVLPTYFSFSMSFHFWFANLSFSPISLACSWLEITRKMVSVFTANVAIFKKW